MQLTEGLFFANHYQFVRLIGRGGFSEVWLAKDKYTHLDLAIKVYAPNGGLDDNGIETFSGEIRRVYNLNHPSLLKAQHFDVCDGMPYLVMPYCANGSVTKRVGKMTEPEVWHLLHDVAEGLAYLHSKDIVHQDIKPDNIMQADDGHYLITDFGISARTRATLTKTQSVHNSGSGTAAYMAPERFSTNQLPIFASDIWALGATIYELIVGWVPFGDGTLPGGLLQKNGAEIPDIVLSDESTVSPALTHVVHLMLSPNAWDRPTAETLATWAADPSKIEKDAAKTTTTSQPTMAHVNDVAKDNAKKQTKRKRVKWEIIVVPLLVLAVVIALGIVVLCSTEPNTPSIEPIESYDRIFVIDTIEFKMVYVQGGTFTMGATSEQGNEAFDDERPTHSVTLSSYYIGETEVTQALWQAVMGTNPSLNNQGGNFPVEGIGYDGCKKFIRKLNTLTGQSFRLPTEAEWEYAARGGNKSRGYKYSGSNDVNSVAWYVDNSSNHTHEVKGKLSNELGLYDMSGNVWEWCNDLYDYYTSNAQTNPKGPGPGQTSAYAEINQFRGGCYRYRSRFCRVSSRSNYTPPMSESFVGFRLAL